MRVPLQASGILYRIAAAFFVLLLLARPEVSLQGAKAGLLLWYKNVVPVQFPFFVAVRLLWYSGCMDVLAGRLDALMRRVFHLPGAAGGAVAAGWICGYPVGAQTALLLYKERQISSSEYRHLMCFCNNPGPLFVVTTVGACFLGNVRAGYILLASQLIAAGLCGLLFRLRKEPGKSPGKSSIHPVMPLGAMMQKAIMEASGTLVMIGGFIVVFSLLLHWLPTAGNEFVSFLYGCLELTNGVAAVAAAKGRWMMGLLGFLLAWGGCCVQLQIASAVQEGPRLTLLYPVSRLVQALLAAAISLILSGIPGV